MPWRQSDALIDSGNRMLDRGRSRGVWSSAAQRLRRRHNHVAPDRAASGARKVGANLDPIDGSGVEASLFLLETTSRSFGRASSLAGNPALYFPSFRPELGREGAVTIASPNALPGIISGQVGIDSQSRLWGAQ